MKPALSTYGLPRGSGAQWLPGVAEFGVRGIEVVPAQTWAEPPSAAEAEAYRRAVEAEGLRIIGLHDLDDGALRPRLLGDLEERRAAAERLVRLSALCRDLGGSTLVVEERRRGALPEAAAWPQCREILERLMPRIEAHGTVLCFAPLPPDRGDFCLTATECRILTGAVDHFSFGHALGLTAMCANDEMVHAPFAGVRGKLDHVHLDEPGYAELGSTGRVDHADFRRHLAAVSYFDWISVVQRCTDPEDPLPALARALDFVLRTYLPLDTR